MARVQSTLICALYILVVAGSLALTRHTTNQNRLALFDARKDALREEQFRIQQEILARRRDMAKNPKAKQQLNDKIEARRKGVEDDMQKTFWARNTAASVDPLEAWKQAKAKGQIKDLGYTPEPPKSSSVFGINIPLIQSPIDVPGYDNGQRFDLRLPYAERGYEDPDADVMGKIGEAFAGLFGGKGQQQKQQPTTSNGSRKLESKARQEPPPAATNGNTQKETKKNSKNWW